MNSKKLVLAVLLAAFILSAFAGVGLAQDKKDGKGQAQEKEKVYIPKDVKAILEQGLATRQGLPGIPVTMTKHLFFPYYSSPGVMHNVFGLKIKNADLPFAPLTAAPAPAAKPEEKKEEKKETTEAFESVPPSDMKAGFDLFLQFREIADNIPGKIVKEVYVPTEVLIPAAEYKPESVEDYFVGYDLPPGNFLMVLAVRSMDQKTMGSTYYEFSTPDPAKLDNKLETTPIIFVKNVEQMQTQENRTTLHRGCFTYLILKVTPNVAGLIPQKSPLDLLYLVIGAKPNDQRKFSLETSMEIKQGDKVMIPYASSVMESPFVNLPLPLKQNLLKKMGTTETKETLDLPPGKYTLVVKITDKVSGAAVTKSAEFEVI